MIYDFVTLKSRAGTGACKWKHMYEVNPNVASDIIPLSSADMEFVTAPEIGEAISQYCSNNNLGYSNGHDTYYEAIVNWMERRHGWKIEKDWILEYPGVVPALYHAVREFTEINDKVILMTPVYGPFFNAVKMSERQLVESRLILKNDRYEIDFDDFETKAKDPSVKLFILSNPHNPVGRVWTREELTRIGRICIDNDVLIVSDEIHSDIILPGFKHTMFSTISEEFANCCIICTAPSKTFNLAGMCTSSVIIRNRELRERLASYRDNQAIYFCNIAGRVACEAAYNKCEKWLDELILVIDENRKFVKSFLEKNLPEIKLIRPEGTYLLWLDFRAWGMSAEELESFMTKEALLFGSEGYAFGQAGEGFERVNIAVPTIVLEQTFNRLLAARNARLK